VVRLERLHQKYKDRAHFYFVYINEAHPKYIVSLSENGVTKKMKFPTTDSPAERKRRASLFARTGSLTMPVMTCRDEAALEKDYAPWPTRFMVIDPKGYIAFNAGLAGCASSAHLDLPTITCWLNEHL
jgi:hypothetical protein